MMSSQVKKPIGMVPLHQTNTLMVGGPFFNATTLAGGFHFSRTCQSVDYLIWVIHFTWSVWFCFAEVIQADLDKVKDHWNSHYIRKSRHDTVPGIPEVLYYLPEYSGTTDCLLRVTQAEIEEMERHIQYSEELDTYTEYFEYVMDIAG